MDSLRLIVASVIACLSVLGCDLSRESPRGSEVGGVGGASVVGARGPCAEGATRSCYIDLGQQGPVTLCFVGWQTCEGGAWSGCSDGEVVTKQSGAIEAAALSGPAPCPDSACDPSCTFFDEKPAEVILAAPDETYEWDTGPSYAPPDGALSEPCATGADCQANHYCDQPVTVACEASKCEINRGLDVGCDPCVDAVCADDPDCCNPVPTCDELYGATTPSFGDCDETPSTCTMAFYNQDLSCSEVCALGGGSCVGMFDNSGTCGINTSKDMGCSFTGYNTAICICDRPPSTGGWDQDCVDAVKTTCGAFCDEAAPVEETGACRHWDPGLTDPACAGINLTVDTPCDGVVPVCNVGQSTAPAGIDVAVWPPGATEVGTCSPDTALSVGTCTTGEPIAPGTCVGVAGCPGLVDGATIMVDPAGAQTECYPAACADNWSLFQSGACAPPTCSNASTEDDFRDVNIFIMIDKSGSMGSNGMWWPAMDAIKAFVASPDIAGVSVGLRFYPDNSPTAGCRSSACNEAACSDPLIPVAPLSADPAPADTQEQALINAIDSRSPGGGTPTRIALGGAVAWAQEQALAHPRDKNVVVFITDGEPTQCNPDTEAIIAEAQEGFDHYGVITYSIGLEGANQSLMDGIAAAGGTGSAFYVSNNSTVKEQLLDALLAIQGKPLTCDLDLPQATAFNQNETTVTFRPGDGSLVSYPRVADAAACSVDGWYYDDDFDPQTVHLCPDACTEVLAPVTACDGPGEQASPLDGTCYRQVATTASWADARADCLAWGGDLASLQTDREAGFVARAFTFGADTWLGLSDADVEGDWRWSDGSYRAFEAWGPSQPDGGTAEGCAALAAGAWDDRDCAETLAYLCEKPAEKRGVRLNLGCPDSYASVSMTEAYEASCPDGQGPQWSLLTWEALTPEDSRIDFEVRVATTTGGLGGADWHPVASATRIPDDTQSCTFAGPSPCPASIYEALGTPAANFAALELRATLIPGGEDAIFTPKLKEWQLTYSCLPNQ